MMALIFGSVGLAAVVFFLRWLLQPRSVAPETFWLSQDAGSEATGPFTVAQLVSLWRQGQITTRGMVTAEGEEKWFSIIQFADRFDPTVKTVSSPLRSVRLLLLLILVFVGVAIYNFQESGTPSRRGKTLGQQLNELENSPRGQQLKAEAAAEYAAEQRQNAVRGAQMDERIKAALDAVKPQGPPPAPFGN